MKYFVSIKALTRKYLFEKEGMTTKKDPFRIVFEPLVKYEITSTERAESASRIMVLSPGSGQWYCNLEDGVIIEEKL